jgi:hypothetical protein
MKKRSFWLMAMMLVMMAACRQAPAPDKIDLSIPWRFHTGDDPGWAVPAFDDSRWEQIDPSKVWEEQGYKGYDGFAWYRLRVFIPKSLIENAFIKDSIQFKLGKIDDCDQVYLNGELLGENGKTMPAGTRPSADFFKGRSQWYTDRRYILSSTDPRVHWDKDNLIAVRAYDQGGDGGMYSKPFEVSMVDLSDHVKFDFTQSGFKFMGDTMISKQFTIFNISRKEDFQGTLKISATRFDNGNELFRQEAFIDMKPDLKAVFTVNVKKNLSVPAGISFIFKEKSSGKEVCEKLEMPYILTPKPPKEPRINGARVFGVRPWSPFQFKVAATGEAPLTYSAKGLPVGLHIHAGNGQITGVISKKGDYKVTLKVTNHRGTAERDLLIKCGDIISLTPPMGWNSWNVWGLSVSDRKVRLAAEAFVSTGLIDHGWTYINIDDGWEDTHDKSGNIISNSKFPNMKELCNYVHSLGLKIGIYSSPGPKTCGGYEGSYTFEEKDARNYADWGIDYLKYDWCSYGGIAPNPTERQLKSPYREMRKYIRKVNRDIHYSLCQYGMGDVWKWGNEVDGNSWRTTGDIEDSWESLSAIGFSQHNCSPYSAPGRWNDPDMLVVGWVGWGPNLHYTRLTPNEQYTHITLWSLLSAPLLIGCDLNQLDEFTLNLLTNDEVLAINQDPLGRQARMVWKNSDYQIWIKELEDGSRAIGLFNLTDQALAVGMKLKNFGITGKWMMRDSWSQTDLGMVETHFEMKVLPHGARLIVLKKR